MIKMHQKIFNIKNVHTTVNYQLISHLSSELAIYEKVRFYQFVKKNRFSIKKNYQLSANINVDIQISNRV